MPRWFGLIFFNNNALVVTRWELDIIEHMMAQRSEAKLAELIRRVPKGLEAARDSLLKLVAEARIWSGNVPSKNLVLAGFSQVHVVSHVLYLLV